MLCARRAVRVDGGEAPMDVVTDFWLNNPDDMADRLDRLAEQSEFPVQSFRFGKSWRGRDLVGFRAGGGRLNLLVVAGMHAGEHPAPYGIFSFIHTLSTGRDLDGRDVSKWVERTLAEQTITLVPYLNIDGGIRMSEMLPGCYLNNEFKTSDTEAFDHWVLDPMPHFGLRRRRNLYLTDEQRRIWTEEKGGYIGQLFSDQGVDLWEDWKNFRAPETRALRDLIEPLRPDCIFEMHCQDSFHSQMFVPLSSAEGEDRLTQLRYGEEMMTALMAAGIPTSTQSCRPYSVPPDWNEFPDYVYRKYRCLSLFGEVNMSHLFDHRRDDFGDDPLYRRGLDKPLPTQEQILRGVWIWLKALVDMGGAREYR